MKKKKLLRTVGFTRPLQPNNLTGHGIPAKISVCNSGYSRGIEANSLWAQIVETTCLNVAPSFSKRGKHSTNMVALLKRVESRAYIEKVGLFYGNNWEKLHLRWNWNTPANPSQFCHYFDSIVYSMEYGFTKQGVDTRGAEGTVYEEDGSWGELTKQPEKEYGEDGSW